MTKLTKWGEFTGTEDELRAFEKEMTRRENPQKEAKEEIPAKEESPAKAPVKKTTKRTTK